MLKKISLMLVFILTLILSWSSFSQADNVAVEYPYLSLIGDNRIDYKSVFDLQFNSLKENRILHDGDQINVRKAVNIDLYLSPQTILRFDNNTTFQVFKNAKSDFTIILEKWQCWANVNDVNLQIKSGKSLLTLQNGTVNVYRENAKNIILSLRNAAKLQLLENDQVVLNELYVPVNNQITIVDSAITSVFAQLKATKLKKELKVTHLESAQIKELAWINANLTHDLVFVGRAQELETKYSDVRIAQVTSILKNKLDFLVFNAAKTQAIYLWRIFDLYQDAFYFAALWETEVALNNLRLAQEIQSKLEETSLTQNFENLLALQRIYFDVSQGDGAYLVKQKLEENILALAGEKKTELSEKFQMNAIANFEKKLFDYKIPEAKIVLNLILEKWRKQKIFLASDQKIIGFQEELVYNILLSKMDSLDEEMLAFQLELEKLKLAHVDESEKQEMALELLNKRVKLSSLFLELRKYKLAKYMAEEQISELTVNLDETNRGVVDYLALIKKEVDTKIAYIENDLHGSAHYNEENYKDYFSRTEAEEDAYAQLKQYQQTQNVGSQQDELISVEMVSQKFRAESVYVLSINIERLEDFGDKFLIKEARTSSGDVFSAKFNASTNALYDIEFNTQKIPNSLLLSEINQAFAYIPVVMEAKNIVETIDGWNANSALAFEMRREVALNFLRENGLNVEKENLVKSSDGNLLVKLKIGTQNVSFLLHEMTKKAFGVVVGAYGDISEEIEISNLKQVVEEFVKDKEQANAEQKVIENLKSLQVMFQPAEIQKKPEGNYLIARIYDQKNKILFEVVYNLEKDIFVSVDLGEFGKLENVRRTDLIAEITKVKVAYEQAKIEAEIPNASGSEIIN